MMDRMALESFVPTDLTSLLSMATSPCTVNVLFICFHISNWKCFLNDFV